MRRPQPRFTVRWLMGVVAISGLIIFGAICWGRYNDSVHLAAMHAIQESSHRSRAGSARASVLHLEESLDLGRRYLASLRSLAGEDERRKFQVGYFERHSRRPDALLITLLSEAEEHLRLADYHGRLRVKYERAARRPWLAVPPDPPVPKARRSLGAGAFLSARVPPRSWGMQLGDWLLFSQLALLPLVFWRLLKSLRAWRGLPPPDRQE